MRKHAAATRPQNEDSILEIKPVMNRADCDDSSAVTAKTQWDDIEDSLTQSNLPAQQRISVESVVAIAVTVVIIIASRSSFA